MLASVFVSNQGLNNVTISICYQGLNNVTISICYQGLNNVTVLNQSLYSTNYIYV